MTYFAIFAFVGILGALGAAVFFMLRRPGNTDDRSQAQRMARALAWRVGLSVTLFLCILLAWYLGYIQPTGLRVNH